MNQLTTLVSRSLSNGHTSIAATVYFLAQAASLLGPVWFPSHTDQFNKSLNIIGGLAVSYGLLMAGDASKSAPAASKEESAANPANTQTPKP